MIRQFFYDMVHMTQGEKLIHYWWLWLILIAGALFIRGVAVWKKH